MIIATDVTEKRRIENVLLGLLYMGYNTSSKRDVFMCECV